MRSLRATLILGTTIGTAIVFAAAGAALYVLVAAGLRDHLDAALVGKAHLFASTVEKKPTEIDLEFEDLDMRDLQETDGRAFLEMWHADGSVLFRSPSLGRNDLDRLAGPIESPVYAWVTLPDGRRGRAVGITFTPRLENEHQDEDDGADHEGEDDEPDEARGDDAAPETLTLVLARDTASIEATLAPLRTLLVLVGLATLAVSAGVLWGVIRRGLRPMDQLAAQIGRLGENDLSERVEVAGTPRELQPVVDRLNGLLGRLDAAFRRERSFSADVAHELRTPLAGLRSIVDVTRSRPRQPAEYDEALKDCLHIITDLHAVIEKLLSLARLEAGQVEVWAQSVVPNTIVRAAWEPLKAAAEARRLDVRWALGPDAVLTTDPELLGLVVRNILENAVAHADEGGSVRIETLADEGRTAIHVSNTGSRLSQDEAAHVFERFWRGDSARSAAGAKAGLGLAVVSKVVAVLGGSVHVRSTAGGDFEVTVSIPDASPSASSPAG